MNDARFARLARTHAAAFAGRGRGWSAAEIRGLVEAPGGVLVERGETGFALARVAADEAELLTLAVDPEARRRGFGRALVDAMEREVRARGARVVYLEVAASNAPARALYRRCGFIDHALRPSYYADESGSDAVLMRKAL